MMDIDQAIVDGLHVLSRRVTKGQDRMLLIGASLDKASSLEHTYHMSNNIREIRESLDGFTFSDSAGMGELPSFGWPGGYQIVYQQDDGSILCPNCANTIDQAPCFCDHGKDQHSPVTGQCFMCPPDGYDANGMTFGYNCSRFSPVENPITAYYVDEGDDPDIQCDECQKWIIGSLDEHVAAPGDIEWTGRVVTRSDLS